MTDSTSEVAADDHEFRRVGAKSAKKLIAMGFVALGGIAVIGWIAFLYWGVGKLLHLT